ncbi:MAG: D-aminoacylase [Kofleriaceae bacterium]|nr:D-aminoacylase [Myxococcales bacterium]MCB9564530.1 D-aminoacylase [Kofleriaceae bacterium]
MHDLVIRGGTVIDGTGAPARRADVAVKDGRIAAIGDDVGAAARTLDADGALVTPGFVDIHTHYDGQASWDEEMMPSSLHGATTVAMGSCGVGFAPCRTADRERLIALMEGVEDIPGTALAEGLTWGWETFPEYMDVLDARKHVLDLACHVPHDAVRVFVMGERALAGEAASEDEMRAMGAMVRDAIERGAVGFSTGRSDNHRNADGRATPAADASAQELSAIARALAGLDHGVLQAVSDFDMFVSPDRFDPEFDLLEDMAAVSGLPLSISLLQRVGATEQWRQVLARIERANAAGRRVRAQVATRGIGVILGLEATFHPFIGFPSYKAIAHLPLEERVRILSQPETRARLLAEKSEPVAGDGSAVPPLVDKLLEAFDMVAMSLFRLGERPDYEPRRESSLFGEAMRAGKKALEVTYDALLEDGGKQLLYFPIYNYASASLNEVGEMLRHPLAMLGLGDGGAHVGTICDASFSTFLLTHWTRDRGVFTPEQAIHKLAGEPAAWLGLRDRGVVADGLRADLNVIDLPALTLHRPALRRDLPAGGKRFLQPVTGYRATIVRGEVICEDGRVTDARPGRVVRAS